MPKTLRLIDELGADNINNMTSTYIKATKPINKIVSENMQLLKKKSNLEVNKINRQFPNTFWFLKLTKNLIKVKFIITAPNCS